jgi:hypothetical protein
MAAVSLVCVCQSVVVLCNMVGPGEVDEDLEEEVRSPFHLFLLAVLRHLCFVECH